MSLRDLFDNATSFFQKTAPITEAAACSLERKDFSVIHLLGAIFFSLRQLVESSQLGATEFRISPFRLTSVPQKILPKDDAGRLRKVSFVLDSAVGGPTPTIRFGNSSVTASNGGARLNAGVFNELGEVASSAELWAASSVDISGYLIERI